MNYAFVFTGFALVLFWTALDSRNLSGVWLLWPALSCAVLAFAYAANRPDVLIGKTSNGDASWFWSIVNLPWLLLTWTTWLLLARLSREDVVNPIAGSGIFISRWPLFGVDLNKFDVVIDLAAELPRWYTFHGPYISLPNLDGIALLNFLSTIEFAPASLVLVHCAQGHGRSASLVALLLGRLGLAHSAADAIAMITRSRPGATLAKAQAQHVISHFSTAI
jgi:hypothetical protein